MYELKQGTYRIVNALYSRLDDPIAIQKISAATNYMPCQLQEDIQALHDFVYAAKKKEDSENDY